MARVDVVVVAYNSAAELPACLAPIVGVDGIEAIVVDNDSQDESVTIAERAGARVIAAGSNLGFAAACNIGWRSSSSPFVLFLNPDAVIDPPSIARLVDVVVQGDGLGASAPRLEHPDGSLAFSQRRYPQVRATYARALFLHRLFPLASWSDDIVRDPRCYERAGLPDWVSGACLLVRRDALEAVGGWDERFFLYGEDIDLCRRLRARGYGLRFEPAAVAVHVGGASSPRAETLPLNAASQLAYDEKHRRPAARLADRLGILLGSLTHAVVARGGWPARAGHLRAARVAVSRRR
jgi:GT2 family glycosyltransferase